MKELENIRRIFMEDLRYKFSIIFSEMNTLHVTLNYFEHLDADAKSFFSRPFDSIKYTSELFSEKYSNFISHDSEYEKQSFKEEEQYKLRFFDFLELRASYLHLFEQTLDALGSIQQAVVERIDSIPALYPPPPTFRQKEIFKALVMIERYSDKYQERIFDLFNDKDSYKNIRKPLTTWKHSAADRVVFFENQTFISSSYWHMLLPEYLPILAHEAAHHYIHHNIESEHLEEIFVKIDRTVTKFSKYLDKHLGGYGKHYFVQSILNDVLCDIIALKVAGVPYFLSLLLAIIRYPFKTDIDFYFHIRNFPFARLEFIREFICSEMVHNSKDDKDAIFEFIEKDLKIFFNTYNDLLANPRIESPFFKFNPNFYQECKDRYSIEKYMIEILNELFLKELPKSFEIDYSYNIGCINSLVKDFCSFDSKSAKHDITLSGLRQCGIEDISDIPFLIWYLSITKCNDKNNTGNDHLRSLPIGRLSQECFRIICENNANPSSAINTTGNEFFMGEVIEVLFMKIRRFFDNTFIEDSDLLDATREVESKNTNRTFYNCIGVFDGLFITNKYSIRRNQEDWPFKLKSKNLEIPYFPRSDVFQEILNPTNKRYPESIEQLLKYDTILIYQIKFKGASILEDLVVSSIDIIENRLIPHNNAVTYMLLKSVGWEDLVIIFGGFKDLEFIVDIKKAFSDHISVSSTTLAYKHDSDTLIGQKVDIISSIKVSEMRNVFYRQGRSKKIKEKAIRRFVSTGLYDLHIRWNTVESNIQTLKDFRKGLMETIRETEALDTYSRITFDPKKRKK